MTRSAFNRYTLDDILIDASEQTLKLEAEFIANSNRNWKKQFAAFKHLSPDISLVIPDWFYLGNKINASDKTLLQRLGITHILNVSDNIPCYFVDDFIYAQIRVDDTFTENIGLYFDAAAQFIDLVNPKYNSANSDQHCKILVHCAVGLSRSATIVIQYLMRNGINFSNQLWLAQIDKFGLQTNFIRDDRIYQRSLSCFNANSILCCACCICWFKCCFCCKCCNESKTISPDTADNDEKEKYTELYNVSGGIQNMSLRNAWAYVKKCRDIVCPNESFATQLAVYEETIRNGVSTFGECSFEGEHGAKRTRTFVYLQTNE